MNVNHVPRLYVVSSPSGGGKSTIVRRVKDILPGLAYSVSSTTRAPRSGEVNGCDYCFLSREEFIDKIARGDLLEHAEVHGYFYGTDRHVIQRFLDSGLDVLLDLDVQGGLQLKASRSDAVLIFVAPPNLVVLEQRLRARATDADEVIALRLRNAISEMKAIPHYDYLIVNDDLEQATIAMASIIRAERRRITHLAPEALALYQE